MDEPTNDLDIETLELLEELLGNYAGTLLLVSHDRAFLDNVVSSTLIFEGDGVIEEYIGGYKDWLTQKQMSSPQKAPERKSSDQRSLNEPSKKITKLSFKEQKELTELPKEIEKLESEQTEIQLAMSDAGFYKQDQGLIIKTTDRLKQIEVDLQKRYSRWDELEMKAKSLEGE
jgi:ATP-binding cassette subfamily F protein uup